jgi:tetratricopeptide (TPR) repeat protein
MRYKTQRELLSTAKNLEREGRYGEAISILEESPETPYMLSSLALAYSKVGNYKRALEVIERIKNPSRFVLHLKADIYMKLEMDESALPILLSLTVDPGDKFASLKLSRLYLKKERQKSPWSVSIEARIDKEVNYDYVREKILDSLTRKANYVSKEGDRYFIDLKANIGEEIASRTKEIFARTGGEFISPLLMSIDLSYLPLSTLCDR